MSDDDPAEELAPPSIFTRIIAGELPGRFVWRDPEVVAFLTISPIRPGHTMVVPVEQIDHWLDVPPPLWARMAGVQQHVGAALMGAFSPARVGTMVLGMEVPHCHVHLVPIDHEADLSFANADPAASPDSLDRAADAIRRELRAAGHTEFVPDA
jgi:diadenosine tetraphosphate (Ap4A) HIT family hydrolase